MRRKNINLMACCIICLTILCAIQIIMNTPATMVIEIITDNNTVKCFEIMQNITGVII